MYSEIFGYPKSTQVSLECFQWFFSGCVHVVDHLCFFQWVKAGLSKIPEWMFWVSTTKHSSSFAHIPLKCLEGLCLSKVEGSRSQVEAKFTSQTPQQLHDMRLMLFSPEHSILLPFISASLHVFVSFSSPTSHSLWRNQPAFTISKPLIYEMSLLNLLWLSYLRWHFSVFKTGLRKNWDKSCRSGSDLKPRPDHSHENMKTVFIWGIFFVHLFCQTLQV